MEKFIIGFIAGEGSFHTRMSKDKNAKFGVQVSMSFSIMLNECDEDLLREIANYMDIGNIKTEPKRNRICWSVTSRGDCRKLSKFIKQNREPLFEQSDKNESFNRWNSLLNDIQKLNKTRDGMEEFIRRAKLVNQNDRGLSADEWIERLDGE